jgi:hypothetical protein
MNLSMIRVARRMALLSLQRVEAFQEFWQREGDKLLLIKGSWSTFLHIAREI